MAIPRGIVADYPGLGDWAAFCGYMAALIDGEGTVRYRLRYGLSVAVYNTSDPLMAFLVERVGGSVTYGAHKCAVGCPKPHVHHWKQRMAWYATGELAAIVLEKVLPFMIVKRQIAEGCLTGWRGRARQDVLKAERVTLGLWERGWPVARPVMHGEYRHYKGGCRCDLCRGANARKERLRRAAA